MTVSDSNKRELLQALLDGKTLINNNGMLLTLENSSEICLGELEQWRIYNEWKMEPAKWWINSDGTILKSPALEVTKIQKFGMKYHTEKTAEKVRDKIRESNLLRYWASVIEPGWEADWLNEDQSKFYIYFDSYAEKYKVSSHKSLKTLGVEYMSEKAAEKICEALNNKELKL